MDDEICEAYTAGFCPYEEFYVEGISKKCNKEHNDKNNSPNKSISKSTVTFLCQIIEDLDRKIEKNKECIEAVETSPNEVKALDHVNGLIESVSLDRCNDPAVYRLLKIHGKLIEAIEKGQKIDISVCGNCGAFKREVECKHTLCSKYAKLRQICVNLKALKSAE
ncbi:hypothetical protein ENBRE01_0361 [Enteropsectra breve]|nr:hypothetical protein ENBRE01_0361 [Enteropsectra breve]